MPESIVIDRSARLLWGALILTLSPAILVLTNDLAREYGFLIMVGWGCAVFLFASHAPAYIRFDADRRMLEISYPFKGLLRQNKSYPFDQLAVIQSAPRLEGDNDAKVILEVILADGKHQVIDRADPEWAQTGPVIGLARCLEPSSMCQLRNRIAALTGAQNRGYLGSK